MKNKKNKKTCCLVLLAIILLPLCAFLLLLEPIGNYLVVQDELQKSDLIAVVSGPDYRVIYASELYTKRLGNVVFITGGYSDENQFIQATWSQAMARLNGVPGEAIAIDESDVFTTQDEAALLKSYIDAHADTIHSVTVVTDPYHSRRTRWIYEKELGADIELRMAPVPRTRTGFPKHWWTKAESRRLVFREYVKLVFYYFRYEHSSGAFRDWLKQFDKY